MMSPEKTGLKSSKKDESQTSGSRKTSSGKPPDQPIVNCPRCDSPNTKFCYYNNYSLTQPRHFCKTCRRYWTKGGALRNVPIGGGCRKNKKSKPSGELSGDAESSARLNFLNSLSPAMDFSRLHSSINNSVSYNQISSFGDISISTPNHQDLSNLSNLLSKPKFNLDPLENLGSSSMGFDFPFLGSLNVNSNLASSIESLSSINQDLHLKLQQQRLGFVFGGENTGVENHNGNGNSNDQKGQPILFENLENCKQSGSGNLETEWYFDNSYGAMNSSGRGNGSGSNWSGVQEWSNGSNLNNCLLP
ncbi:hypothetical protein LguiA_005402 [Lonicera macranthoides]